MPREQKEVTFYLYDIKEKEIKKIFKEEDKFWINFAQEPLFLNENEFIWLSEKENLSLPFIYSIDGNLKRKIKRNFIVEKVIDFDKDYLYFLSISPNPLKRELIKYSLKDGKEEKIFKKDGFLSVQKLENSCYFLVNFSKVKTPYIYYLLNKKNGEEIEIFNSKKDDFEKIELPEVEFLKIEDIYGLLMKPKDFVPSKKYPLIVYVYGGPHAQVVSERFGGTNFLFHSLLVQDGFLVASIDNRGSYGRGKEFEGEIYKEFGKKELEDQLKYLEYLKKLNFIDEEKIGIWGWSYGGFMVLYALTHTDIFKAGFAVAPVTDWNFYDTIYTERYLGLPEENKEGYFNSSPINFVKNLKGKLYLVHGTGDDNVHFQNSTNFINELIKENISFNLMVYPERNHSIRDEKARVHLFKEILNFFKKEL
jgi:dipeptidyl-peptidase-4